MIDGLINPEIIEQVKQKARKDAMSDGLIKAGSTMLSAPPRRVPYSNTELLGHGIGQGLDAFNRRRRQGIVEAHSDATMQTEIGEHNREAKKQAIMGALINAYHKNPLPAIADRIRLLDPTWKPETAKSQLSGATKEGLTVSYNPSTGQREVAYPDGRKETYDKGVHGEVLERTDKRDRNFTVGTSLMKMFNTRPAVAEFEQVQRKYSIMAESLLEYREGDPSSLVAVDQALITMFNKVIDPSSVVRESEYARTSSDIAILNAIRGKIEKYGAGGAGLTDAERTALVAMTKRFYDISREYYMEDYHKYNKLADLYELPSYDMVTSLPSSIPDRYKKLTAPKAGKSKGKKKPYTLKSVRQK